MQKCLYCSSESSLSCIPLGHEVIEVGKLPFQGENQVVLTISGNSKDLREYLVKVADLASELGIIIDLGSPEFTRASVDKVAL